MSRPHFNMMNTKRIPQVNACNSLIEVVGSSGDTDTRSPDSNYLVRCPTVLRPMKRNHNNNTSLHHQVFRLLDLTHVLAQLFLNRGEKSREPLDVTSCLMWISTYAEDNTTTVLHFGGAEASPRSNASPVLSLRCGAAAARAPTRPRPAAWRHYGIQNGGMEFENLGVPTA